MKKKRKYTINAKEIGINYIIIRNNKWNNKE